MKGWALSVVLLTGLAGQLAAQDIEVLRPVARPVPEAPLRPEARPVGAVAGVVSDEMEALPVVVSGADVRPRSRTVAEAVIPAPVERLSTSNFPPSVIAASPLERAEARMQGAAVHLLERWDGAGVAIRPDYIAVAAVQPFARAPLRPAGRPHQPWMDVVQLTPGVPLEEGDAGDPEDLGFTEYAVALALRPPERPAGITEQAVRVRAEQQRGAICGSVDLQGDSLGRVDGPGSCGVEDAVRVRTVAGVRLSTPATMNCTTARALLRWVQSGALPAIGSTGGGLASLRVASDYSCRNRNNQAGGRLSEHAFGRAIDISAFGLRDGTEITVLRGWNSPHGERLRRMWRAACGPFGTVLGPNANRFHRDHFHFDTASYRSGSYCR
jgi:hypothetical protein